MAELTLIHEAVQERYGAIALQGGSCCGPSDCCGDSSSSNAELLYNADLLDGLPVDVTGLSLGCGDPVTIAALHPGETVLDLGSGGGIDCFLAARQVGPTGRVIGVDMTPAMLAQANANKQRMGVTNVEFRQGQIEAMPVGDARSTWSCPTVSSIWRPTNAPSLAKPTACSSRAGALR